MDEQENNQPAPPLGVQKEDLAKPKKKKRFGISSSVLAALMVAGVAAAWLASGYVRDLGRVLPTENTTPRLKAKTLLPKVKTRLSVAQMTEPKIIIRGSLLEAERSVTVRTEVGGKVIRANTQKEGEFVRANTLLCSINIGTKQADRDEAKAMMGLRGLELRSAEKLTKQGYNSKTALARAHANYDAAKARLERSSQLLEKTSILAPYDGIVEKVFVDVGDVVASGAPCARVIDMDPLIISGKVTEDEVVKLRTGVSGWAILPGGLRLDGILRYIAHSADEKTKTYRVELETNDANTNNPAVRAGITAQIHIPLRAVRAHSIPSSILTLNEQGKVGLRLVQKINNKNIVQFTEIEIIEGNADTYWVKGLPEKVELIIVGQEYVQHGTEVAIDRTRTKP